MPERITPCRWAGGVQCSSGAHRAFQEQGYRRFQVGRIWRWGTLKPPFSELFAIKTRMDGTCQRLGGNEANCVVYLIDKFQGDVRPRTLLVARGDIEQLPPEESAANDDRHRNLMSNFNPIVPHLTGGEEAFTACRPAAGLHLCSVAQFNEFQDWLLNPLDGIADAAPESASTKWTLSSRTVH